MYSRQCMLDLKRGSAWLKSNRGATQLRREAPYQWLIVFLQELFLPGNDLRWKDAKFRAIVYLSFEKAHGNFLLRRAFPFRLKLLELSQCLFDSDILERLQRKELVYLDRYDAINDAFREISRKVELRCCAVPVATYSELRGVLLLIHVPGARLPTCGALNKLGSSMGAFAVHALRLPRPQR